MKILGFWVELGLFKIIEFFNFKVYIFLYYERIVDFVDLGSRVLLEKIGY